MKKKKALYMWILYPVIFGYGLIHASENQELDLQSMDLYTVLSAESVLTASPEELEEILAIVHQISALTDAEKGELLQAVHTQQKSLWEQLKLTPEQMEFAKKTYDAAKTKAIAGLKAGWQSGQIQGAAKGAAKRFWDDRKNRKQQEQQK